MDLKSSSITADILNILLDGRRHTLQSIADELNVSKKTIQRHIQSLSFRFPIQIFVGGRDSGGVKLDSKYIINGKIITNEKLQTLGKALELLQSSKCTDKEAKLIKELINDLTPPDNEECEYENFREEKEWTA